MCLYSKSHMRSTNLSLVLRFLQATLKLVHSFIHHFACGMGKDAIARASKLMGREKENINMATFNFLDADTEYSFQNVLCPPHDCLFLIPQCEHTHIKSIGKPSF
uniref:Uncharacterized protein n=1 Tax=Cyclophora tenuis TaxID=216820 RepID=A0A7S1GKR3_CYCTE